MRLFRPRHESLPEKFDKLARYNSEVARGLVHTVEWAVQMNDLQREFVLWSQEQYG